MDAIQISSREREMLGNFSTADVVARAKRLLNSKNPKVRALAMRANEELVKHKLLTPGQVHNDTTLANLSVQYKNEDFIGLQLMPVVTVDKLSNKYAKYGKRDRLSGPDDQVTTRSVPNEIAETRTFGNYSCLSYALMDFVDEQTLANQDAPLNEMVDCVAAVNDILSLKEEQRIASILTTAANYSGNTVTLAGTDQWAVASGADGSTSNPIANIQAAVAAIWSGFGSTKLVGFCSLDVYNALRRHASIVDKFKYTQPGIPARQILAGLLDLDDLLVGKAWQDAANEGQTASYTRVWGKHFGILRVAQNPGTRTACFGNTFRFGQKTTRQWFDPKIGPTGGYYAKVGMAEDHRIVAPDTGYLIVNAIA